MVRCFIGNLELSNSNYVSINQGFIIIILDLCLSFLNGKVLISFDDRFLISFILIKLQKMFNKMNHRIFLGKLNAIGFSSKTITWFKSYLPDQIFWVKINNYLSELSKMSCGVQQGLNFDLLLFLSYVNVTNLCLQNSSDIKEK